MLAFMDSSNSVKRIIFFISRGFYWVVVLAVALFVFIVFLKAGVIGISPKIKTILDGTSPRPFVYRVLLPMTANFFSPILRSRDALSVGTSFEKMIGSRIFTLRLNGRAYPREVVLIFIMMYVSLVGFSITIWHFLTALGYSSPIRYGAPPLMLLGAIFFFGFGYIYDFSTLFLFSLGLFLMSRQNWFWFLVVFALGTLNKETTIFLSLVFGVYFIGRLPRRQFIALLVTQLGIYGIIQGIIRFTYRNNPGYAIEWHLPDQVPAYVSIAQHTPYLLVVWGAACIIITFLVIKKWNEKPLFVRVALAILPFFLVLFIFWAYPLEIRDLLEVFPVVAILMLPPPHAAI